MDKQIEINNIKNYNSCSSVATINKGKVENTN